MSERQGGLGRTRMEALSDGVFAVSLTLLIVDIASNEKFSAASDYWELWQYAWPKIVIFAISFTNIGLYWVAHNNEVKDIEQTDRLTLWLNLYFLLFRAIVPFSSAILSKFVLSRYVSATDVSIMPAMMVYAANFILLGVVLQSIWAHGCSHCPQNAPAALRYWNKARARNCFGAILLRPARLCRPRRQPSSAHPRESRGSRPAAAWSV